MKLLVSNINAISLIKPQTEQGGAGLRRQKPHVSQLTAQSAKHSWKITEVVKIEKKVISIPHFTTPVQSICNPSTGAINRRMMQRISKDIPFYPDPVYRPTPKPVQISMPEFPGNMDINPEHNNNFKENSPFKEDVISETYQGPDK